MVDSSIPETCASTKSSSSSSSLSLLLAAALMEDQAANLLAKGIPCAHISSAQPEKQRQAVLRDLASPSPRLKLVLVTPELIATPR